MADSNIRDPNCQRSSKESLEQQSERTGNMCIEGYGRYLRQVTHLVLKFANT